MASDPSELLTANLPLIERAVAFACRRSRLDPDDAEEFGAVVKLKLVENDYAILRSYEARSGFATFISVVVQRMALDYRIHLWGKWHTTAEAKRLGDLAIELEKLLHRDGRTLDEALVILKPKYQTITKESLAALADRLPPRAPRMREVAIGDSTELHAGAMAADQRVLESERRRTSEKLSTVMSAIVAELPEEDQLILQLRFEGGMAVSQIARALQIEQKLLYRRLERRMKDIRAELERRGVNANDALDLIGRDEANLAFDLGNRDRRPSIGRDERAAKQPEEFP
ncbi:MAG TPA: sigma-70 family RNA polymerase sigma factor [Thermoanaerobaculia bacterium]|nr:sigma-70 family RNA polymerase sigma factor [Thermoanaerobaculia bacterium]